LHSAARARRSATSREEQHLGRPPLRDRHRPLLFTHRDHLTRAAAHEDDAARRLRERDAADVDAQRGDALLRRATERVVGEHRREPDAKPLPCEGERGVDRSTAETEAHGALGPARTAQQRARTRDAHQRLSRADHVEAAHD